MTLKAILTEEEYEGASEVVRGHYTQSGDSYRLEVEAAQGWGLDHVQKLREGLTDLEQEKRRLAEKQRRATERLKKYEDEEGNALIDPDEARKALQRLKEGAKTEEKWSQEKRGLEEAHQRELSARQERIASLENQIRTERVDVEARRILATKGIEGDADLLLPHVKDSILWEDEDGKLVMRVRDADKGGARFTQKQGERGYMGLEEFISTDLRKRFPRAFNGTGAVGTGANADETRGSGDPAPVTNGFTLSD